MSNDSDKDGNSSGDQIVEVTPTIGGEAVMAGEQSTATPGTGIVDPGTLQHFQTTLMNLVSEAGRIGLSLPIGLGISSPYELVNTSGNLPPGRLRSEVHVATPSDQARPSLEETPQDHPEAFERRRQRKGKEMSNEESLEERDHGRAREITAEGTHQRGRRRHRSPSYDSKSPQPKRGMRLKKVRQQRSESAEDQRADKGLDSYGRITVKSRLDSAGEPTGQRDVTLQELSKKVSAIARRYGRNMSSDDESDKHFIDHIART